MTNYNGEFPPSSNNDDKRYQDVLFKMDVDSKLAELFESQKVKFGEF